MAGKRGVMLPPNPIEIIEERELSENPADRDRNIRILTDIFGHFQQKFGADLKQCFILVVIPAKTSRLYKHVKQAAEIELEGGILTQCIVKNNLGKCQDATVGNLLLKINSKLGGLNQVPLPPPKPYFNRVDILSTPVLIVGIDVTHPPPTFDKVCDICVFRERLIVVRNR